MDMGELKVVISVDGDQLAQAVLQASQQIESAVQPIPSDLPVIPALLAAGAAAVASRRPVSRRALLMPWRQAHGH